MPAKIDVILAGTTWRSGPDGASRAKGEKGDPGLNPLDLDKVILTVRYNVTSY